MEDAELCFGIARAAAVAGFQHVFPPDLYEFPADAIRADWIPALTGPRIEQQQSVSPRGRRTTTDSVVDLGAPHPKPSEAHRGAQPATRVGR